MALLLAAKLKETNTSNCWKVKMLYSRSNKRFEMENEVLLPKVNPSFPPQDCIEFNNISLSTHNFTIYCTIKCNPLIPAELKKYDEDNVGDLPSSEAALFGSNDLNELVIVSLLCVCMPPLTCCNYTFH